MRISAKSISREDDVDHLNDQRFRSCSFLASLMLYLLFTSFPSPGLADDEGSLEKRSCIQSVDGYSYLSEDKTVAELRTAALNNAKQQALTNAKTYIRSRTEVDNFVLKSDNVLIDSEGTVKILEQKDHGIQDNSRYHIWIKAEVEYQLGEGGPVKSSELVAAAAGSAGQTQSSAVSPPPSAEGPLTVKVWSPKKEYKQGEKIEIFVRGNRDFYARIVDINSQGQIVQLLPNEYRGSSPFKGGTTYKIPDTGDQFDLTVSPPFGTDRIVVYASEVPLGQVNMQSIGKGLSLYEGDRQSLAVSTRGIAVTGKKTGAGDQPIAEFYETTYEIATSK
jgi:hypothetical protein